MFFLVIGHKWASPSVPELRRLMRHVSTHYDDARGKGAQARADMVAHYAPQVIAQKLLAQLNSIYSELDKRRVNKH